jgi:hypothetical protein
MEILLAGPWAKSWLPAMRFSSAWAATAGAESKTLSGEGVANIKIMGKPRANHPFESSTKTVWLAAENETDQKHLLPFGWAVVEIDPQAR